MSDELKDTEQQQEEEYARPDPKKNPRNIILEEIAKGVHAQHEKEAAEQVPLIDDDGNITLPEGAPPAEETPAEDASAESGSHPSPPQEPAAAAPADKQLEPIDPNKLYRVKIDGQEVEVPGKAIIDAGFRTFQKETAADFRLRLASQLLEEAEARVRAATPKDAPPAEKPSEKLTDEQLAHAIQFGTAEQAAAALKELRGRPSVTEERVASIVDARARRIAQDEIQFQEALSFVQSEYADLLANDYLRRLFLLEENRRRAPRERGGEGDTRPYKELYRAIGEDLRKAFGLAKPAGGPPKPAANPREQRKQEMVPVPKTAAARMKESEGQKAPSVSEVIAKMAAARGQDRLIQTRKGA